MRNLGRIVLASGVIALLAIVACGDRTDIMLGAVPGSGDDGGDVTVGDGSGDVTLGDGSDASDDGSDASDARPEADVIIPGSCTPRTCKQQGFECGANGDGCGNLIQCGKCVTPEICGVGGFSKCGGGWGIGPDGGPICVPRTCKDLGLDCGPSGDGCGGVMQCGTCQPPLVCGAAGNPGRCGSACVNLCQQQVQCDSGTTTLSGTVVTGTLSQYGNPDPVPGALVYVPNGTVQAFAPGVACNTCGADVTGDPLVETNSAPDGTFTLQNVPVGSNIPLVIQLGRWRRQVTISTVTACVDNPQPQSVTRLPRNKKEGDIPFTAIATGFPDPIECVLMKLGVDQAEFTQPSGNGRVNIYQSNGSDAGPGTPNASQLWSSASTLEKYDQVLLPCEGQEITKSSANQQNVIAYTSAGGRVFTTHYGYTWLYNVNPFSTTATWNLNADFFNTQTGDIDVSFQKGKDFSSWLSNVGALSGPNQITLTNSRHDVDSVNASTSLQYMYATNPQMTLHYTFQTPVGAAKQCGRVVFSDFHVVNAMSSNTTFPNECPAGAMTAQEKALEYMLLDLASCVPGPPPVCVPGTCASQGFNCGPEGDGCGNQIQCGTCTSPQSCGGGGVAGKCGYPDAGSCVPQTCGGQGFNCGISGDGCGGTISCGSCSWPQVCGGGGKPNVCGS